MAIVAEIYGSSTTVTNILSRAARLIGAIGAGENLSAEDSASGFEVVKGLIDSVSNSKLLINRLTLDTISVTGGDGVYTIGSTGDVISTRPIKLDPASYIDKSGISYPLTIISAQEYNNISDKASTSDIPRYIWMNGDFPNATLTLYPVPSAACTLKLWSWKQFASFSTVTETVSLPPGYVDMLVYNTACNWAPEFQVEPPRWVVQQASLTMKRIKRTNAVVPTMSLPSIVLPHPLPSHIESGQ